MKIGIDAKWFFNGPVSGKLFIQNVLNELLFLEPEIEWHIFLDKKTKEFNFPHRSENIKLHYVWASYNLLSNLYVLPRWAKLLNLDAVFSQTFSPKSKAFKSIVFVHDVLFEDYPQYFTWRERIYFKPQKKIIRNADRIVTTSNFVRQQLEKFHYTKNHQHVNLVPLGVADIFKPLAFHNPEFLEITRKKFGLPEIYLLIVGRLNARKNIETLIRSLSFLNDKKIHLVIVGEENWKAPNLEPLIKDVYLKSRLKFTGAVTDDELSAIYAMSKIFCFPSFAEGFGLPPLEAMASGIPVVVSNTTCMPEVCGPAALYFDPREPEEIAASINLLLENKNLYEQKRIEGLKWSQNYTWKKTAQGILNSVLLEIEERK